MKENIFNIETYNYSLPKELIAQYPCEKRDESKLLSYNRVTKNIKHQSFKDIINLLNENDVLVLNDTKVIQARFYVLTENKKEVEIVLVNSISTDNLTWNVISGPQKHLRKSKTALVIENDNKPAVITSEAKQSHINTIEVDIINAQTIKFKNHNDLKRILNEIGKLPLPHYIERNVENNDLNRYQTVFAKNDGAIAAPTAALHFTHELIEKIKSKGIEVLYLTLHVGPGTFMPIRKDDIREHSIHPEEFFIDKKVWDKIIENKKNGKRIIACGTTVVRTLEYISHVIASEAKQSYFTNENEIISGHNDLYISPGYEFQIVDAIITNFHLPKTSLLLLVSAFISWRDLKYLYDKAIYEKYRFFSYGDAMFLS